MTHFSIQALLQAKVSIGQEVVAKGWIRTTRTSKAGVCFIHLHDGSCFDPIQIVVDANLENYESEVLKLTTGCALEVTGTLVASEGKGQNSEILASKVKVVGWVENPNHIQCNPNNTQWNFSATMHIFVQEQIL